MTQASACVLALVALAFSATQVSAQATADQKKYADCVEKVKKSYRVPPGYAGTLTQKIKFECGEPPK